VRQQKKKKSGSANTPSVAFSPCLHSYLCKSTHTWATDQSLVKCYPEGNITKFSGICVTARWPDSCI